MIRMILAFVVGFLVAASLAWFYGHTPTDQLTDTDQLAEIREEIRRLRGWHKPQDWQPDDRRIFRLEPW